MQDMINNMVITKSALQSSVSILSKVQLKFDKTNHVQFDRGSQKIYSIGKLIILDSKGNKMVRAGCCYGLGLTNNKMKSFKLWKTYDCLDKLAQVYTIWHALLGIVT